MDESQKHIATRTNLPATIESTKRGELQVPSASLNAIAADLTEEQRQALGQKIVEQQIDIMTKGQDSNQRHIDSARDINVFVSQVGELERQTRSDVEASIHSHGASGTTDIRIKKSNNQNVVYIIVAIAIALVALLVLRR